MNLEDVLKCDGLCDINSLDLFSELKVLREVLQRENDSPIETLDYIKGWILFQMHQLHTEYY